MASFIQPLRIIHLAELTVAGSSSSADPAPMGSGQQLLAELAVAEARSVAMAKARQALDAAGGGLWVGGGGALPSPGNVVGMGANDAIHNAAGSAQAMSETVVMVSGLNSLSRAPPNKALQNAAQSAYLKAASAAAAPGGSLAAASGGVAAMVAGSAVMRANGSAGGGAAAASKAADPPASIPLTSQPLWFFYETPPISVPSGLGEAATPAEPLRIPGGVSSSPDALPSELAERLRMPIFGVSLAPQRPGDLTLPPPPPSSVAVKCICEALLAVQPVGPFALCGVGAAGCAAALEVACALQQWGGPPQPVMLLLLDLSTPSAVGGGPPRRQILAQLSSQPPSSGGLGGFTGPVAVLMPDEAGGGGVSAGGSSGDSMAALAAAAEAAQGGGEASVAAAGPLRQRFLGPIMPRVLESKRGGVSLAIAAAALQEVVAEIMLML